MAVYQFSQFIEADFVTEALYVCPVPEIYFIIVRAVQTDQHFPLEESSVYMEFQSRQVIEL